MSLLLQITIIFFNMLITVLHHCCGKTVHININGERERERKDRERERIQLKCFGGYTAELFSPLFTFSLKAQ